MILDNERIYIQYCDTYPDLYPYILTYVTRRLPPFFLHDVLHFP